MSYILLALAVSFCSTLVISRAHLARKQAQPWRAERKSNGSLQGFGRAGGIGIATGLLATFLARALDDAPYAASTARLGLVLLLSAVPVLTTGLTEDFTQRVSKRARLGAALASAGFAGWLLGAWV